ncbi:MAG: hypothetical protein JNK53_05175 [Phycisphaerae bacterium]|nr:hypothetical protein [Phycisphaerae bacterium]
MHRILASRRSLALTIACIGAPLASLTSLSAHAETIPIVNGSFETRALATCAFGAGVNGWNNGGVWHPGPSCEYPGFTQSIPDGDQVVYVHGVGFPSNQVLSATLQPNTTYTLRVAVGQRYDVCCPLTGYKVVLGTQTPQGQAELAVDPGAVMPSPGTFLTSVVTFTTGESHPQMGQPLVIQLHIMSGVQAIFDHVRLTAEPANSTPIPGDIDMDGDVDGADLGALLGGWGPCADCNACPGDFDNDCDVDGADLGVLLAHWG